MRELNERWKEVHKERDHVANVANMLYNAYERLGLEASEEMTDSLVKTAMRSPKYKQVEEAYTELSNSFYKDLAKNEWLDPELIRVLSLG